ncbi:hypothetical protein [Lacticaseibacillus paracasei]|uniref:hypothetical protein n=1 Tax=Lacticaseibacillus paracasei TaxID=1597 RepID=UPI0009B9F8D2|nr:hypothetical protein [Lacticaseibacillus paracasei]MCD0432271.1 hypothetical protein [Lacticaseibacillus paracasei subsp. paracasei]
MPRRSNRRPDGTQPCKQHSDRARSAVSALAARRHPSWPEIAEFGTAKNVCNRAITSKCR